jgi:hypothetical protein
MRLQDGVRSGTATDICSVDLQPGRCESLLNDGNVACSRLIESASHSRPSSFSSRFSPLFDIDPTSQVITVLLPAVRLVD